MYRIFLVEDDAKIAAIVRAHLEKYGYEVTQASDFANVKAQFQSARPDLVLLDINLPRFDGYYWCRQIRTVSKVPVIFLTARSGEMDQVLAIENGGDDYLSKPFNLDVLTAKVKSVLRRAYGEYAGGTSVEAQSVSAGPLLWDRSRLELAANGDRTTLSRNEGLLLDALLAANGRVVSREALLEKPWSDTAFVDDNTLTVNVNRLRRKLAGLRLPDAIQTLRGEGYKLSLDEGGNSE